MPESENRMLFDEGQIRTAFVLSGVGMVALLVFVLILATSRPQGTFQEADDSQFQATLLAATENLEGYELVGETRARIDIGHAIELVADRGVDLSLTEIGSEDEAAEDEADETGAADTEGDDDVGEGDAEEAASDVDGEAVYASNCVACHQANGQGVPGAFPPLAGGHAAELLAADGGRDYLIATLLYGLQGSISVAGQSYDGQMPAWGQLSDGEIAAVLDYVVTGWDNADALPDDVSSFTADEIADARDEDLSPSAVLELRPDLP